MSIQELEGKRHLIWDDSTNEEYLARVQQLAKEKAKEIIMLAELEAEGLRATARHEGYQEGLVQAQAELDQHTQAMWRSSSPSSVPRERPSSRAAVRTSWP